jgi:hypothetical protein
VAVPHLARGARHVHTLWSLLQQKTHKGMTPRKMRKMEVAKKVF